MGVGVVGVRELRTVDATDGRLYSPFPPPSYGSRTTTSPAGVVDCQTPVPPGVGEEVKGSLPVKVLTRKKQRLGSPRVSKQGFGRPREKSLSPYKHISEHG